MNTKRYHFLVLLRVNHRNEAPTPLEGEETLCVGTEVAGIAMNEVRPRHSVRVWGGGLSVSRLSLHFIEVMLPC